MKTIDESHEYAVNNLVDTVQNPRRRILVVINQKQALVFRSEVKGTDPEHLFPTDAGDVLRNLKHTIGADATSKSLENFAYYKADAEHLADADEILIMGNGTGSSSAMNHFTEYLESHHKEIAKLIVGTLTVDIESLTEGQLLKKARAYFLHEPLPAEA